MLKSRGWTLAIVAGLALTAAQASAVVNIDVECAEPSEGTAVCDVVLNSDGGEIVGGMQNDLLFDNAAIDLTSATKCRINNDISFFQPGCMEDPITGPCKNLSSALNVCGGDPQPPGCPEGADEGTTRYRGIIAATAFPNTNEIPNGSVLYSCTFDVVDEAALPSIVTNSNIVVSDPQGTRIDEVGGSDGQVGEGAVETPTPEPTEEPTPEPTEPPGGAAVNIDVECAEPSEGTAVCDVVLNTDGSAIVGGMQNDLLFENGVINLTSATKCRINNDISFFQPGCMEDPIVGPCKNLSSALNVCGGDPQPPGCPEGSDEGTTRYRGIIAATAFPNTNEIPNGSVLYSCTFDVVDEAALPSIVTNSNIVVSDPQGTRIDDVGGSDGQVGEGVVETPTPEPTEEPTEVPTDTPAVPTDTPAAPTATPEPTATATNTQAPAETPGETTTTVAEDAEEGDRQLVLVDASAFPAAGIIQVGTFVNELSYSNKTGNTLTLTTPLTAGVSAGTPVTLIAGIVFFDDDDGCNIAAQGSTNSKALWLLVPLLGVVALRRRLR
jgi:cell division septation protein DedD